MSELVPPLPFGAHRVWEECTKYRIRPDANGNIRTWVVDKVQLILINSYAPAVELPEKFVLFSRELTNKTIRSFLTVLKTNQMPSGFRVSQALLYRKVFVVDPDGDFTDAELLPLDDAGIEVVPVPPGTPQEMSESLDEQLSS